MNECARSGTVKLVEMVEAGENPRASTHGSSYSGLREIGFEAKFFDVEFFEK
jgi:hypothetical protein